MLKQELAQFLEKFPDDTKIMWGPTYEDFVSRTGRCMDLEEIDFVYDEKLKLLILTQLNTVSRKGVLIENVEGI